MLNFLATFLVAGMLVTHYVTIAIILFLNDFFDNHSVFINFIGSFPSLTCLFMNKSKNC